MRLQNDRLCVFSGRMLVGKDFVAKKANLEVKGFADPIYQLVESLCGTSNKSIHGIRKMMQWVGQIGWGCVNDSYPHTPERAHFTRMIRTEGKNLTRDFKWVNWSEYGSRQDFWVNILLTRLGLVGKLFERDHEGNFLFPEMDNGKPYRIGITNARFEHELKRCETAGFEHFHVRCTEDTRRERMLMSGYDYDPKADKDVSEQMAFQLDSEVSDDQVIWNDFRSMPPGRKFLTVEDFVDRTNGQERFNTPTLMPMLHPPIRTMAAA